MKVTIKTIAEEMQLSFSTIARALKDDKRISTEVRERVNQKAREMGYVPNMLAKGLVSSKSRSIGFIMNDLSWSFFSELSVFIQDIASDNDYSTLLFSSANNVKKERMGIAQLRERRIDGMIIFANENEDNIHYLEEIVKTGFPVILMNNLENDKFDIVCVDNTDAAERAVSYLISLGHRRIAYIGPTPVNTVEKERYNGYRNSLIQSGIGEDPKLVYTDKAEMHMGSMAMKKLMSLKNRPTAVMVYNDTMAVSVLRAAYEMSIKVPGELSIISIDGLEIGEIIYPSLTTVKIPIEQLAEASIKQLIRRIDEGTGNKIVREKILLKPELILRESTTALE